MVKITVVDYGVGNIHSIRRGLESAGAEVLVARKESNLKEADGLVLPGVGAFKSAMESWEIMWTRLRPPRPTVNRFWEFA